MVEILQVAEAAEDQRYPMLDNASVNQYLKILLQGL